MRQFYKLKIHNLPNDKNEKGYWINGENLKAFKYPCVCTYDIEGKTRIGQLTKLGLGGNVCVYELCDITEQTDDGNVIDREGGFEGLIKLVKEYNIHIQEAKTIVYIKKGEKHDSK